MAMAELLAGLDGGQRADLAAGAVSLTAATADPVPLS